MTTLPGYWNFHYYTYPQVYHPADHPPTYHYNLPGVTLTITGGSPLYYRPTSYHPLLPYPTAANSRPMPLGPASGNACRLPVSSLFYQ